MHDLNVNGMRMRRLLLAVMLACCAGAQAQAGHKALTGKLRALHRGSGFPGFAVATVTQDGVAYRHGFGYADIEAKRAYRTSGIVDDEVYGHSYYLNDYSDKCSALLKRFTR